MRPSFRAYALAVSLLTGVLPMGIARGQSDHPAPSPAGLVDGKGKEVRLSESWTGDHVKTARESDVESALVAEDWQRVEALIGETSAGTQPVERLIKAHACLALNRNNDSILLFLSATTDDLKLWREWTSRFAEEQPRAAIAEYLLGDSLARIGLYDKAVQAFDVGLEQRAAHPLLLNAQGVAYARLGELPEARKCFDGAIAASQGKFADAHANLGQYWIARKEGAEGCLAAFGKAIEASPGFLLAAHGRLCVLVITGRADVDEELGEAAIAFPGLDRAIASNVELLIDAIAKRYGAEFATRNGAGTFIQRSYVPGSTNDVRTQLDSGFARIAQIDSSNLPEPVKNLARNFVRNHDIAIPLEQAAHRFGVETAAGLVNERPIAQRMVIGDQLDRVTRTNAVAKDVTSGLSKGVAGGLAFAPNPYVKLAGAELGVYGTQLASEQNRRMITAQSLRGSMQWGPGDERPRIATPDGYRGTVTIPSHRAPVPVQPSGPGGADLSMKHVTWDDGDWPFVPLFGLAYGMND